MTIEKLSSGSYRIRAMAHGKRYSLTVKKKPSERIARQLIEEKIALDAPAAAHMSFKIAGQKYINVKSNVLSPSTVRCYNGILRNLPKDFLDIDVGYIRTYEVQKVINDYAENHSPKSTHNVHGFISAVLKMFCPDVHIHVTLPQKPRTEHYTPSQDDVKAVLDRAKDTDFYVPLYLATLSCRTSEICALSLEDLHGDELTINKALVKAEDGYVLKPTPKTDASNRIIVLPHDLADRIRQQGYVYNRSPRKIYYYLQRSLKRLGIPAFPVHKLRHFFASYAHDMGYSDAQIQKMGGWSTDDVMKRVYRHALNENDARKQIASDFKF